MTTVTIEVGNKESFRKMLSSALKISDKTSGLVASNDEILGAAFFTRCVLGCTTIWNILNPKEITDFPEYKKSFKLAPDFPSSYDLLRALYENLINLNYVLNDPCLQEEKDFRIKMWERHTLNERLELAKVMHQSPEIVNEINSLQTQKSSLEKEIFSSSYFNSLPANDQQSIKSSSNWCRLKTKERADLLKLRKGLHDFLYRYLSSYSHSEGIALEQIDATRSPEQAKEMETPIMFHAEMILCLTIDLYAGMQPEAKKIVSADITLQEQLKSWQAFK